MRKTYVSFKFHHISKNHAYVLPVPQICVLFRLYLHQCRILVFLGSCPDWTGTVNVDCTLEELPNSLCCSTTNQHRKAASHSMQKSNGSHHLIIRFTSSQPMFFIYFILFFTIFIQYGEKISTPWPIRRESVCSKTGRLLV